MSYNNNLNVCTSLHICEKCGQLYFEDSLPPPHKLKKN